MAGNIANIDTGKLIRQIGESHNHMLASGQSSSSINSMLYGNYDGGHCLFSVGALNNLCALKAPAGFSGHIFDFLLYVIFPISMILSVVVMAIGVILIALAIYRIREHSVSNSGRQRSFMATTFYFIAGAIFLQYGPLLHMLSASTFYGFYSPGDGYTDNILSYVANVAKPGITPGAIMQQFTFALLLLVGMFSFLRGVFMLIKLGEGGGQEGVLPKCLAHLIAGIIGINAEAAWHGMCYMSSILGGS